MKYFRDIKKKRITTNEQKVIKAFIKIEEAKIEKL